MNIGNEEALRRALLAIAGLLALCLAMLSTTPGELAARKQDVFPVYLPMLMQAAHGSGTRGSAGCYLDGTSSEIVNWCFSYYPPATTHDGLPYEVVPLVSARLMQMAGNPPLVVSHPDQPWLIFNEPDNIDPQFGDNLTPAQGAALFKQYADTLQPQGAKLICCANYYTPAWMDSFLSICGCLDRMSGISFHDYAELWIAPSATDAQKLANWTAHAQAWVNWLRSKQGAYPTRTIELWATEIGWSPCCEPDEATALRHMQMICGALAGLGLTRYAWFNGQSDAVFHTAHIGLFDANAQVNALGLAWAGC